MACREGTAYMKFQPVWVGSISLNKKAVVCNLNLENVNEVVEHEQMKLYKPFHRETFHNTAEKTTREISAQRGKFSVYQLLQPRCLYQGVFRAAATDQVLFQALLS